MNLRKLLQTLADRVHGNRRHLILARQTHTRVQNIVRVHRPASLSSLRTCQRLRTHELTELTRNNKTQQRRASRQRLPGTINREHHSAVTHIRLRRSSLRTRRTCRLLEKHLRLSRRIKRPTSTRTNRGTHLASKRRLERVNTNAAPRRRVLARALRRTPITRQRVKHRRSTKLPIANNVANARNNLSAHRAQVHHPRNSRANSGNTVQHHAPEIRHPVRVRKLPALPHLRIRAALIAHRPIVGIRNTTRQIPKRLNRQQRRPPGKRRVRAVQVPPGRIRIRLRPANLNQLPGHRRINLILIQPGANAAHRQTKAAANQRTRRAEHRTNRCTCGTTSQRRPSRHTLSNVTVRNTLGTTCNVLFVTDRPGPLVVRRRILPAQLLDILATIRRIPMNPLSPRRLLLRLAKIRQHEHVASILAVQLVNRANTLTTIPNLAKLLVAIVRAHHARIIVVVKRNPILPRRTILHRARTPLKIIIQRIIRRTALAAKEVIRLAIKRALADTIPRTTGRQRRRTGSIPGHRLVNRTRTTRGHSSSKKVAIPRTTHGAPIISRKINSK